MNKLTKEQQEELWKWCGRKHETAHDEWGIDLNSLFQWAVPKLQAKGYQVDIICFEHKGFDVCVFNVIKDIQEHDKHSGDNLALALFWAIWEVIHE